MFLRLIQWMDRILQLNGCSVFRQSDEHGTWTGVRIAFVFFMVYLFEN
jgi:hypothetical protein